jgi:hypothetical protein
MYASRHLRLRPRALGEKLVLIGAEPARPTALALFAQEDDRWILGLAGYAGHHPPADPDGFLAAARGIAPPHVSAAIADADPPDDIRAHRFPANTRRRYERLRVLAGNLRRPAPPAEAVTLVRPPITEATRWTSYRYAQHHRDP